MKRRPNPKARAKDKARRHQCQKHACFCGRTFHNDQAWREHKTRCVLWSDKVQAQDE